MSLKAIESILSTFHLFLASPDICRLLGFRYVLIELAIQELQLQDITEMGAIDSHQVIQVHNFREYRFLDFRLRHKLHHVRSMRSILDKFYPGFFVQTEIIGLPDFHHFVVSRFLANKASSSKWRRQWHSSRKQWELEMELPQIIGTYPSTYSQERLPGIDPDSATPDTASSEFFNRRVRIPSDNNNGEHGPDTP